MEQKDLDIIVGRRGRFVVRACPGSGKTYSVAVRLENLLSDWNSVNKGIAILSFTNVAWKEIREKLSERAGIPTEIKHPHFLGTIDSFINRHIFLPFGHKVMGCDGRPILVGEPHGWWPSPKHRNDYRGYFDKLTFDISGELIRVDPSSVPLTWKKKSGEPTAFVGKLRKVKEDNWAKGYATQLDANYFALQLLETYPKLAKEIVGRFPMFILDEAQDTSEVQMRILDKLVEAGLEEVMLVGDPDQAIFEWNNAKPELFLQKYDEWSANSLSVNTNRRSSQLICDATHKLTHLPEPSEAITEGIKAFKQIPLVWNYGEGGFKGVVEEFKSLCTSLDIPIEKDKVAVLSRSRGILSELISEGVADIFDIPFITHQIFYSAVLFQMGDVQKGITLLARIYFMISRKKEVFVKSEYEEFIAGTDRFKFRKYIANTLLQFPAVQLRVSEWIPEVNTILAKRKIDHTLQPVEGDPIVSNIFYRNSDTVDYRLDTVHGAKGETFEAVLLFLKKKGAKGAFYKTMIKDAMKTFDHEELRTVYVGITRPRRLLVLAVPDAENQKVWSNYLNV